MLFYVKFMKKKSFVSSDTSLLYIFSGKSLQQSARLLSTLICQELVVISAASTMFAR